MRAELAPTTTSYTINHDLPIDRVTPFQYHTLAAVTINLFRIFRTLYNNVVGEIITETGPSVKSHE